MGIWHFSGSSKNSALSSFQVQKIHSIVEHYTVGEFLINVARQRTSGGKFSRIRCSANSSGIYYNYQQNPLGLYKPRRDVEDEGKIIEQVVAIKQQAIKGGLRDAHAAIQELFAKFPNNTRVLIEFAHIEARRGNHDVARSLFSRAIDICEATGILNYDYVLALQGWGSSEARASNASRARLLFEESVRAAQKLGEYEQSQRATVYGLHAWAMVEDKLGNWSQARDLLHRAAEIQPGNAVVHQSRALMEARAHNYSLARFHFRLAAQADPNDAKSWQAWALFEASQRRFRDMRRLFYRAYLANKNDLHTLQAWAHQESLIETVGAKNRARKLYQKCVEINPHNMHAWQSWALLEERSKNYQGARVLYEQGLKMDPSNVPCLQAYARLEKSQGNTESARMLLQEARKIDPYNAPSLMESAMLEEELGNHDVAHELYKRAGKIDKQKSRVRRLMFISRKMHKPKLPKPSAEVVESVKQAVRKVLLTQEEIEQLAPGLRL